MPLRSPTVCNNFFDLVVLSLLLGLLGNTSPKAFRRAAYILALTAAVLSLIALFQCWFGGA